ncbi:hypothetical protein [Roseobacter sp.]|uniref:hypothetical protein n=1 Tax=Roseobacter sp. TaxID=1907202 RepID=UPI0025D0A5F0|nr:hypothetical protein [Roseobacter sp.]
MVTCRSPSRSIELIILWSAYSESWIIASLRILALSFQSDPVEDKSIPAMPVHSVRRRLIARDKPVRCRLRTEFRA